MLTPLTPYPAALIKKGKNKTLIIADPHLGCEMALHKKGIHVPSQTFKLIDKLKALILKHKPEVLLILGDVKYSIVTSIPCEGYEISLFFNEISKYVSGIGIVRGNHDGNLEPMLPENVKIYPASGLVLDDVGLFHGHTWSSPLVLGCKTLIMGHLHPVAVFRDPAGFKLNKQVWVKIEVNPQALAKILLAKHKITIEGDLEETLQNHYGVKLRSTQILIMPCFNDFLGGRPMNELMPRNVSSKEALIGPILRSEAVNVDNAELYLLDGTYLGTLNQLRNL